MMKESEEMIVNLKFLIFMLDALILDFWGRFLIVNTVLLVSTSFERGGRQDRTFVILLFCCVKGIPVLFTQNLFELCFKNHTFLKFIFRVTWLSMPFYYLCLKHTSIPIPQSRGCFYNSPWIKMIK